MQADLAMTAPGDRPAAPPAAPPHDAARARQRTCIVGRDAHEPAALIRFVLAPDGVVTPDLAEKLPGRGAWVASVRARLVAAVSKGHFSRALKATARTPDGLDADGFADFVEDLLATRTLSALGLARRAGEVVIGLDAVLPALRSRRIAAAIAACDAGADGLGKARRAAAGAGVPLIEAFSSTVMSGALGLNGVKHVGLRSGPSAARLIADAGRLAGFRPVFGAATPVFGAATQASGAHDGDAAAGSSPTD